MARKTGIWRAASILIAAALAATLIPLALSALTSLPLGRAALSPLPTRWLSAVTSPPTLALCFQDTRSAPAGVPRPAHFGQQIGQQPRVEDRSSATGIFGQQDEAEMVSELGFCTEMGTRRTKSGPSFWAQNQAKKSL